MNLAGPNGWLLVFCCIIEDGAYSGFRWVEWCFLDLDSGGYSLHHWVVFCILIETVYFSVYGQ